MLLKLLCCEVGTHKCVDVADDGCEVAPQKALAHHKVYYSTDECEVPVVPKVDIDSTCGLGDEHEEVDAKTDWDDERTYSGVVSHSGSSRPTHVKHVELQMIDFGDALERIVEVGGKQCCNYSQTNEAHTDIKTRLECLAELHADAKTNDGEEYRHHHRSAKTDYVTKNLIHLFLI